MIKYIIMKKVDGWGEQYWSIEGDFNADDACIYNTFAEARKEALELSYRHKGIQVLTLEIQRINHFEVKETEEIL